MRTENDAAVVDDVITQTLGGQHVVTSADTLRKLVDGVSQADVNAVRSCVHSTAHTHS
jgi:hypothetical protein